MPAGDAPVTAEQLLTTDDADEEAIDRQDGDPAAKHVEQDADAVAVAAETALDPNVTKPGGEAEFEVGQPHLEAEVDAVPEAHPETTLDGLEVTPPAADPVVAAPAAAAEALDVPGLEPLISLVGAGIVEIDAALQLGSDVRVSLTALASGVPGDDREVIGYLRRSLAPTQDRLLSVLAGLSEERRSLDSANAHLQQIYTRRAHDATDGLMRVAELTAPFRTSPLPVVPVPVGPASQTPMPEPPVPTHEDTPRGPGGPPLADGNRDHGSGQTGSRGQTSSPSAVSRLAGALRRSAGQALGVYQVGDPVDRSGVSEGEAAGPAADSPDDGAPAASAHASALHSPARSLPAPVRRTAKYAALIGVPALFFSGIGGVTPRVDAVPAPPTPIAQVSATMVPSLAPAAAPTALPGVATANEAPLGDDAAVLPLVSGLPGRGTDPGTLVGNGIDGTALASLAPTTTVDGAVISYRGPTSRRVVALTFDDGYSTTALKRIYTTLVVNQVAATFFVNGIYLSRSPQVWRQIADAGFAVGNHTYHHVDIRHLTPIQLAKELATTAAAWRKLTGTELIPYFRPPYGAHNRPADTLVAADGYPNIVLWSNSVADTAPATTVATGTAAALRAGPGGIVLLHIGPALTPELLQGVIDGFRARGFSFVTIPELLTR
jgi:peptidoglycan/xylan/chitin deacetylase (PgdA/CDA1 family)